jgi:Dyp-type peroxidase family
MSLLGPREVPASLSRVVNDPARPDVGPGSARPEPVLALSEIQGNVLPGFSKDHQTLLFLRIESSLQFRRWMIDQIDSLSTAEEVLRFNELFKLLRRKHKSERVSLSATWVNIAFTFQGLQKLEAPDLDKFSDEAFRDGLAARAVGLNDPMDPAAEGNPERWVVGGTRTPIDALLIVASDTQSEMLCEVARLLESLADMHAGGSPSAATLTFREEGANLPPPLSGHEHFGFLDGVSQPGVRGRVSNEPHNVFTPRQNPEKRDQIKDGKIVAAQGKPGQDLLWPGEFVFGYPRQIKDENPTWDGPNGEPGPDSLAVSREDIEKPAGPDWARNGSYLVFRRLRQDVGLFHHFLRDTANSQGVASPTVSTPARALGAALVGRWPSGAPVMRSPDDEMPSLAASDCANNYFEYADDTEPLPPADSNDPSACTDDNENPQPDVFPPARADENGDKRLAHAAHIRKAYPRDDEDPGTDTNESNTQTHRMMRRGIPFGPVSASTPDAPFDDDVPRGLHFLAYQTSISDQFEFVTQNWINNPDFLRAGTGHDPIIGQSASPSKVREFKILVPKLIGGSVKHESVQLKTGSRHWVIPTGGGYFFSPSVGALNLLCKE